MEKTMKRRSRVPWYWYYTSYGLLTPEDLKQEGMSKINFLMSFLGAFWVFALIAMIAVFCFT